MQGDFSKTGSIFCTNNPVCFCWGLFAQGPAPYVDQILWLPVGFVPQRLIFVKFLEDFIEQYIALVKKSLTEYEFDKLSYFMNLYDEFYETINNENILEIKPNQLS